MISFISTALSHPADACPSLDDMITANAQTLAILVVFFLSYIAPTLIANKRKKKNASAIMALNVLVGWTGFGWVAALIWSLLRDPDPAV